MDLSNKEFTLLTSEQIFGKDTTYFPCKCIDVINKIGKKCAVTDFAVLLGASIYSYDYASYDNTMKERTGWWYSSSSEPFSSVVSVNYIGKYCQFDSLSRDGGIRPVLSFNNINTISRFVVGEINGIKEIEYGMYPQYAVDEDTQNKLESLYGIIAPTRNTYTVDSVNSDDYNLPFSPKKLEEYEMYGKRFVRVKATKEVQLSTGRMVKKNEYVWVEVSPIEWFVDENEKLLISKRLLVSGIRFSARETCSDFKNTEMYMFLNRYFKKDIIQYKGCVEKEVISPRREQYEKKINPYGLNFNKVTEEDIIKGAIESNIAVFLHGRSSEGKSARVKQIDKDCIIIYLRNATPERLNGKSVYDNETGIMIDIKPTWLQKLEEKCASEPEKNHIVFFDEITNALPSIQGSAFNIVLDREVNGIWKLPENARIVAAGNDINDSLAANRLAEPLFNRFAHVYINTTVDSWLKWASEHNIHPAIYAYIAYKKDGALRSEFNGETPNADPRKWELASKMLYATGQIEMLRSLVGDEITNEFVNFCNQRVITLEDVLNNRYTNYDLEMNTSEKYATIIGLSQVSEENYLKVREFVSKLGGEFCALFDSLWSRDDIERLEVVSETRLIDKDDKVLCKFEIEEVV